MRNPDALGRRRIRTEPLPAISHRTRFRPTAKLSRRRCRVISLEPYHGVSGNFASIGHISAILSGVSPVVRWWNADELVDTYSHSRSADRLEWSGSIICGRKSTPFDRRHSPKNRSISG